MLGRCRTPLAVDPPNAADVVDVGAGRHIEYAEFGDPDGVPVLWLHGTPGSCRQVAPAATAAAIATGVRIIGVARPGVGRSTAHRHDQVIDVAGDMVAVADHLALPAYAVIGLSGGGPYALAVGVRDPARVRGIVVLGGVAPTVGHEAAPGGIQALAAKFEPLMALAELPLAWALTRVIRPLTPLRDPIYAAASRLLPEPDQRVFAQPGVKDMFLDDLIRGVRGAGMYAALHDALLFGRHWGFDLADVPVPVHWLHGDEDTIVPLAHGEHASSLIPDVTFKVHSGGSHLSGYAAADDVIAVIRALFGPA